MQCLQLTRGEPSAMTVDVVLSGRLESLYGYVTIDGTTYTSAQTIEVATGTIVYVHSSANSNYGVSEQKISFNGTAVAQDEYTFEVTDNCSIAFAKISGGLGNIYYYTADITMPA